MKEKVVAYVCQLFAATYMYTKILQLIKLGKNFRQPNI